MNKIDRVGLQIKQAITYDIHNKIKKEKSYGSMFKYLQQIIHGILVLQ